MRTDSWTAERIELLRRLWAQGETAAAIAARLGGLSRSAVLGKIFRLRLDTAAPRPNKQGGRTAKTAKKSGSRTKGAGAVAGSTARPSLTIAEFFARRRRGARDGALQKPPEAVSGHKTLLELTNNTCRWPHGRPGSGTFFFCGAAGADLERGIPYCELHMRRAYTVPELAAEAAATLRQTYPTSAIMKNTSR
jgi:GcrA cell cycle regulator